MANKNDALKKHHFWILAGVAPLLVLLANVFLMTGVSGAIDAANADVAKNENEVKSANAAGTGTLAELEKKKATLGDVRGQLWKLNWDKQAPFFTWPETPNRTFDRYNTMKFGTNFRDFISNTRLYDDFKPAYQASYDRLAASIAPTAFKGNWQSVLRWVSVWGNQSPESRQLWLAMEDLWVQRALLQPITQVNEDLSRFTLVKPDGQNPPAKKRKFVSRVWELDLEVVTGQVNQRPGQVLRAKLKNRTGQLQVLGVGSAMLLKVWFDPKLDLPPFDFRIEGAGVAGGETIPPADPKNPGDAVEIPLPPGTDVVELAQVKQVLDKRTVPVRRLDRLALGYLSAKDFGKPLNPPAFFPDAAADPAAGGGGLPPMGSMPGGGTPTASGEGNRGGPVGTHGDMYGSGSSGGAATTGPGRAGPMRLVDVADLNKKRYLEINEQLRRVPVAMTLVVDQMYVNEVLIAYANSPLRFEAVQYHWQRFTDSLSQPGGTGGPGDPFAGGSSADGGESAVASGSIGAGLSGGYGPYPPPGVPGSGDSRSSMGMGSLPGGSFGGIPGLGSDTLSNVSEAQANAGLVQLTLYGIVTLYERYEPVKKEGDAAAPVPPADATAPAPMGGTPAPAGATPTPMGTAPTPPAPMTPTPMGTAPMTPAPAGTAPPAPAPMGATPSMTPAPAPMGTTPAPTTPVPPTTPPPPKPGM